ncbi:unnamed protein product [Rotaria sp. Silwood2]|nr:unnamed protein product [Rotaria sp. Silwood2]CAF4289793.1 unnamed protein product [Rotaria sp. Silwood2]
MQVQTKLVVLDNRNRSTCTYTTMKFNKNTKVENIKQFILGMFNNLKLLIDMKIEDPSAGFVTLNDEYLKEFKPFSRKAKRSITAQPINPKEKLVTVQITVKDHDSELNTTQESRQSKEVVEVGVRENEPMQPARESASVPESTAPHSIELFNDPKMGFVQDYNVNETQRDQYLSDARRRPLVKIQGKKDPSSKAGVLPRLRIWHGEIQNRIPDITWSLLAFIVLHVRQSGKSRLFYHPIRAFVKENNVEKTFDHCETPIEGKDWTSSRGAKLKLTIVTIKEAKVYSNVPVRILCELKYNNESKSSKSSIDNSESCHIALVLRKDNDIQWETLVLSDPMIFPERTGASKVTNLLINPTSMKTIASGQNKPKKRQTNSNKQPRKTKIQKGQDHLSIAYPSTNNNSSNLHVNQALPVYYNTTQVMDMMPQSVSHSSQADFVHLFNELQWPANTLLLRSSIDETNDQLAMFGYGQNTNMNNLVQNANSLLSSASDYNTPMVSTDANYLGDLILENFTSGIDSLDGWSQMGESPEDNSSFESFFDLLN